MKRHHFLLCFVIVLFCASRATASVYGDVSGTVIDPQQQSIAGATITLLARSSAYSETTQTDGAGHFLVRSVPVGEYTVSVESSGFSKSSLAVTVLSDRTTVVRLQMTIAPVSLSVNVRATPGRVDSESPTPVTLV